MTRPQFVRRFWPLASVLGAQFGFSPVAMIAHALKESGVVPNGNPRAEARHNYFGFKSAKGFMVYPDDLAGWTAYARRMVAAFPKAVAASHDAHGFAQAVAYSTSPAYVTESAAQKAKYVTTLRSIHKSVSQEVSRLNLRPIEQPIAGVDDGKPLLGLAALVGVALYFSKRRR